MIALTACCGSSLRALTRAAARAAGARLRAIRIGQTAQHWSRRAEICEGCPMRVVHRGLSYCGRPFLENISRDDAIDGCGCPTVAKAKSPDEHCPLNRRHQPAVQAGKDACDCKWCVLVPPI